jgi:hypothetical protein
MVEQDSIHQQISLSDASLIVMSFERQLKRRMRTSFPSKLSESVQFAKPLLIWGPDYCSAVRWARSGDNAVCVTEPDAASVVSALRQLAGSTAEQTWFADRANNAANSEFNPDTIRKRFLSILEQAATSIPRRRGT